MRLESVQLKNFRSYKSCKLAISDLTALVGRNDAGKSTILEGLEIFFNGGLVKMEADDFRVDSEESEIEISCVFDDIPDILYENLKRCLLLDEKGTLTVSKRWSGSSKKPKVRVYFRAHHRNCKEYEDGSLLNLSLDELKKFAREKKVDLAETDQRNSTAVLAAVFEQLGQTFLSAESMHIDAEKGAIKKIFDEVESSFPIFALFQADRPSQDQDSEVQDPMKIAIKEAIAEQADSLNKIAEYVRDKALEVANETLSELRAIDEGLATELVPDFTAEPKWESVFKIRIQGDKGIPINKRGSGVRRLILLSFFKAQAKRKVQSTESRHLIYAIEEPETSQHPANQRLLINTLIDLSTNASTQVLLTTHNSALAGLIPVDSLRLIKPSVNGSEGNRVLSAGDSGAHTILQDVADELGVVPTPDVRCLLCVEGPSDVQFLYHVAGLLHAEDSTIVDLRNTSEIVVIPLGGSTLKQWVENHYFKGQNIVEFHIYDGDAIEKYKDQHDEINARDDGSWAKFTTKLEIENYLPADVISTVFEVSVSYTDQCDLPLLLAESVHKASGTDKTWNEVNDKDRKKKESRVKKRLFSEVLPQMTLSHLDKTDPNGEVRGWLMEVSRFLQER